MKTDVCFVISHGFAARMLFQTGLIRLLAGRGLKIAIITPDAADDNVSAHLHAGSIAVFEIKDRKDIWSDNYQFKRKYYLEDIRKNPVLWEKHIHGILYSRSYHPWRRIRPLLYLVIFYLNKLFPSIRSNFIRKEQKYLLSREVEALLKKISPSLVVSTYPVNLLEARTLFAAKRLGIATLIHLLSWDNITSKGRFPVTADYYIAWGEIMLEELMAHYEPGEENIHVCGVPHFDHHLKVKKAPSYRKILQELQLNPEAPYLFVAMSAPRFAPREIDIVEWLAGMTENGFFGADMQLIVRPHPQNVEGSMADTSWLGRLYRLKSGRIAIDYPMLVKSDLRWSMKNADMDRLSNLLVGCAMCINSGSTVSIDALTVGKPVILTSFDGASTLPYWHSARRLVDYPHLKKFVGLGGAQVVRSYETLRKSIQDYLADPDRDLAARNRALHMECFKNDGMATLRAENAVLHILDSIKEKEKAG